MRSLTHQALLVFSLTLMLSATVFGEGPKCKTKMINPIKDICWRCMFPITVGSMKVVPSSKKLPDTNNPKSPICICEMEAPPYMRIGLTIGYWEPFSLSDVTRVPYCMVNMGFKMNMKKNEQKVGGKTVSTNVPTSDGSFYHVHWYKYPVIFWLQLIQNAFCLAKDNFDVAYMSELDPLWDDDELSFLIQPEAILFGNPLTQLACIVDALKTSLGNALSIDTLFWCAGSHGSMYTLTGNVSHTFSNMSNATLISERMNFKLHRLGVIWESFGTDKGVCKQYPRPILPKSRYRYQFTRPEAESTCHPYGTTTTIFESGKENPSSGINFGFVNFRKRNCCFL